MSAKTKAAPKPDTTPKPCPTIALTAVQEVFNRTKQEQQIVLNLARQASGLGDGKWSLDIETGMWSLVAETPRESNAG